VPTSAAGVEMTAVGGWFVTGVQGPGTRTLVIEIASR